MPASSGPRSGCCVAPGSASRASPASPSAARCAPSAAASAACGRSGARPWLPAGGGEPLVEAVALWVHLDPDRRLPSPLTEAELEVYAESAGGHQRARAPAPPAPGARRGRAALALPPHRRRHRRSRQQRRLLGAARGRAARRAAASSPRSTPSSSSARPPSPAPMRILASGARRWITDPEGDEVYASIVLMNARTTPGSNMTRHRTLANRPKPSAAPRAKMLRKPRDPEEAG